MKLLLDTHILIWTLMRMPELSPEARELIEDRHNLLYYSTVSAWEVAIKHRLRPERIPCSGEKFVSLCGASDMYPISLNNKHISVFESLKRPENAPQHKDPFDQILISQAKAENMVFLTHDKTLQYYDYSDIRIV
mgnify:CR=1 FL=1